jgi:hypothetical protein
MQTLSFNVSSFGQRPNVAVNTGVVPGLTTVLTGPRSAGGKICKALTPNVTRSFSEVSWNESEQWYELRLHGSAHDPIPEAALKHITGSIGASVGSALTPDLEWDMTIRLQRGREIDSGITRLRYGIAGLGTLDRSGTLAVPQSFGGTDNLIHGLAYVRRFPSYVAYMSVSGTARPMISLPVYFSDARVRNLGEILIGQTDPIRQLTW